MATDHLHLGIAVFSLCACYPQHIHDPGAMRYLNSHGQGYAGSPSKWHLTRVPHGSSAASPLGRAPFTPKRGVGAVPQRVLS